MLEWKRDWQFVAFAFSAVTTDLEFKTQHSSKMETLKLSNSTTFSFPNPIYCEYYPTLHLLHRRRDRSRLSRCRDRWSLVPLDTWRAIQKLDAGLASTSFVLCAFPCVVGAVCFYNFNPILFRDHHWVIRSTGKRNWLIDIVNESDQWTTLCFRSICVAVVSVRSQERIFAHACSEHVQHTCYEHHHRSTEYFRNHDKILGIEQSNPMLPHFQSQSPIERKA